MTVQELAERAGVSRGMVQRIESGNPRCEIGVAFELASLVGAPLFQHQIPLHMLNEHIETKLGLLPSSVRPKLEEIDNDF